MYVRVYVCRYVIVASCTSHFAAETNAFAHLFLFALLAALSPETVLMGMYLCMYERMYAGM